MKRANRPEAIPKQFERRRLWKSAPFGIEVRPLLASRANQQGETTMKLYDSKMAPNPRRVRIFLAEKGIQVPDDQVDLAKAQNRSPEFLKINPMGGVPVLQMDDGTNLADSGAICRYFAQA